MSKIALSGNASGTGTLTFAAPNTNTDRTLTLPDNSGTVLTTASTFAGTGPIFSARPTTNQTITSSTWTKVNFGTENFDSASCYDTGTSIFTPNVAGYYQISIVFGTATSVTLMGLLLRKNNADFRYGSVIPSTGNSTAATWSGLVYMNGTTDYLDVYGFLGGTTPQTNSNVTVSVFEGFLARAA